MQYCTMNALGSHFSTGMVIFFPFAIEVIVERVVDHIVVDGGGIKHVCVPLGTRHARRPIFRKSRGA